MTEQPVPAYAPEDIEFISKVIRETKAYQAATAFGVPEDAHKTCADELATAVLAAMTPMMEELANQNDRLSRLLSEVPARLEESKRQIMAYGVRSATEALYEDGNEFVWTKDRGLVIREDPADRRGVTLHEYLTAYADRIEMEPTEETE